MVVLWRIGNLELAATAQVDELAREPKSVYHEPWPERYQPSGTCRQAHHSVTKEVLCLACQGADAVATQGIPVGNGLHGSTSDGQRNRNSGGDRMPAGRKVAREDESFILKPVWVANGARKNPRRRRRGVISETRGVAGVGLPDQFPLDCGDEPVELLLILLVEEGVPAVGDKVVGERSQNVEEFVERYRLAGWEVDERHGDGLLSIPEVRVLLGQHIRDVEPVHKGLDQVLRERFLVLVQSGSNKRVVFVFLFQGQWEEGTLETVAGDTEGRDKGGKGRWFEDIYRHGEGRKRSKIAGVL